MALPNIQFEPVFDIHLLRGMSANLIDMLRVGTDTAIVFRNNHPTVIYTFTPFIKNTSGAGNLHTGSNITVDTTTGAITTLAAAPVPEKRNFLIKAVATLDGEKRDTLIRIHIHQSIAEAWLSPSILTVQKISGNFCKFSVRVRFNDNVVADISEGTSFNQFPNNFYNISWTHPNPGLVNPATGTIDPMVIPGTGQQADPVTATINPSVGAAASGTGIVFIADQLAGANPSVRAQLITSGRSPGWIRANEVPNVLFIPDGFRIEDRDIFDRIIDDYVSDLSKGKITAPFDILAGSINFWKVFLASGDRGVTSKCEVYVKEVEAKLKGVPLPAPDEPQQANGTPNDNAAEWWWSHLLYHVGLPLKDDVSPLVRTNALLRAEWKLTTLLSVQQVNDIRDEAIENWRRIGERRLPEERDTVLGLLVNDHSAPSTDDSFNMINFNMKRVTRSGLNAFLNTLNDVDGNPIGKYFISAGDDNELQGKDSKNIVFVSAATRAREQNTGMGFFVTIKEFENSFDMVGNDISEKKMIISYNNEMDEFSTSKKAALTHELGHSFSLEDEYGETPPSNFHGKFINDPIVSGWPFTRYTKAASALDWASNAIARNDLLSINANNHSTNLLDATKLKWRYHRIDKCSVLTSRIIAAGNTNEYKISVRPGHTQGFAKDQKAFLRKRVVFRYQVSRNTGALVPPQNVLNVTPQTIHLTAATVTNINAGSNQITINDANAVSYVITFIFPGAAARFNNGDVVIIERNLLNEPIYSISRTPQPLPNNNPFVSDTIIPTISQELNVVSVNNTTNEIVFKTADGNALSANFLNPSLGEEIIFYKPMDAPSSVKTSAYKYAEVISKKVLDYLVENPFPFSAKPDSTHGNTITEIIDDKAEQDSSIPNSLVPSCSRQKKKIVAIYSGGDQRHGDIYHATAKCFMRTEYDSGDLEEFCVVCKYTLVNMIDPRKHDELNAKYKSNIYPT